MAFMSIASAETPTYNIGIKEAKPFVYQENGVWKGYSIDLLDRIAKEVGFTYHLVKGDTVTDLIDMASEGKVDMSISAISTTEEREKVVDFSHPYFSTTQGILVKEDGSVFWWVAERVLIGIAVLIAMMYVVGWIAAAVDDQDEIDNAHKGAWWALVTFTTTGYGDYVPGNAKGKVVASIWMVASLFLLSVFTGYIASSLTVKKLTDTPTTLQSLYKSDVVTLEGSTSDLMLTNVGVRHKTVKSFDEAYTQVEKGKADAFVYDKAMLDFVALKSDNPLTVWPINKGQERYAIAFPTNSPLRESVNLAILDIIDSQSWKSVNMKYFGE